MKQIDIKIQQNKAHYDLDRQSANHQEMFEFFYWHICFTRKDLLEKAATIKRLE